MKRIYSTLRPTIDHKSYVEWVTRCNQKLTLSSRGLIAFTSSFCLNQPKPSSTSYHVYITDINTPYKPYLLVDSEYEFTIVEWDPSGSKLLVCDIRGCATIYTSKDYLISDWKPYFQHNFAAETFIATIWYHPGICSTINVANQNLKSPSNQLEYSDKVQQTKFGASLRLFGGKSAEGCLLVSRTGLVCCLTLMADGSVDVLTESLSPLRTKLEVADICYNKDGSFVVGTSAGSINSTISFYQIHLTTKAITFEEVDLYAGQEGKRVQLACNQFHSFHLNIMAQILRERENALAFERVAHIKFITKDSPDEVLVEVSGPNLSLIELWELDSKKKPMVCSAIIDAKNATKDIKPNNISRGEENGALSGGQSEEFAKEWAFKGNYITDKDLVTIQVPKFKIFGPNRQLNIILLAYKDSSICCMRKEDLQPIFETLDLSGISPILNSNGRNVGDNGDISPYKVYQNRNNIKPPGSKSSPSEKHKPMFITDIQFSANQTVFVAIDTMSQLHAVRLPPLITCQDRKDQETYLQYILEYCLITGNDWWDAMVCIKSDSIESVCDKIHDAYERQPKHTQRKYSNKQLMIRASLYRCLNTTQSICKASDCHAMIMLNSFASTLKSVLRSQDQDSPAEHLSNFLKTHGTQADFFKWEKVISEINEKEFYVEISLIQYLQPLCQWVTDLAIFLVVSAPQRAKSACTILGPDQVEAKPAPLPGAGLASNKEALETLRELLIIIKIWGLQNEASLPVIHKLNDQLDPLATLYRLVSICYATLSNEKPEDRNKKPNQPFIDECVQFANSISVPHFLFSLEPIGIASPLLHQQPDENAHLKLEFFKEPTMPPMAILDKVEGAINMNGSRKIDVVRNISLGAHPVANLRHCTRCKSVSLIKQAFNTTRSWEQRWISSCVCGGSWAQSDSSFLNKVGYLAWLHHNSTVGSLNHTHAAQVR